MIPSRDLPAISPPDAASIASTLASIRQHFLSPVTVDLRQPLEREASTESSHKEEQVPARDHDRDDFETRYLRGWLERVVQLGLKQVARAYDQATVWESIVDDTSAVLARLEDDSEDTDYVLPAPSRSPSLSTPSVRIHNHTLVSSTTGHRTWGSAPLLARRIALDPDLFFPVAALPRSLRVLELGSGTGLVGLSALTVLERVGTHPGATVTLSDGGEVNVDQISTSGVIENLCRNLEAQVRHADIQSVSSRVQTLRWDDFLTRGGGLREGGGGRAADVPGGDARYDVILGADLVYEAKQAESLWAAVASLLRFPVSTLEADRPAFHLVIPLRPTHVHESESVDKVFPPSSSCGDEARSVRCLDGKRWRLVARERQELRAPDGFGRMGESERIVPYRLYRIEWQEL